MTKDINFEDLPEKMQSDWIKYIERQNGVNILKIKIRTNEATCSIYTSYIIYYEYENILGVASYFKFGSGMETDTHFDSMTLGDLKELYNLSTLRKQLDK